jgi:uncharacterized protein (TIGR03084 family)
LRKYGDVVPADIHALLDDLMQETALLVGVLEGQDEAAWSSPTPAEGWKVVDQITHLAYFDEAAVQAALDPTAFNEAKAEAIRNVDGFSNSVARRFAGVTGPEALSWFRQARGELVRVYTKIDPASRIPWYGPDMSPASAVTARIMETWAHGQDIMDALAIRRQESPGLRQVAHLGFRTLGHSFVSHGRPVPADAVRVVLTAPDGEIWAWGPDAATDEITGPARDFCLVVTQRRHPDDTELVARGAVAAEWLTIAQAFAGPSGSGRQPGQVYGRRSDGTESG